MNTEMTKEKTMANRTLKQLGLALASTVIATLALAASARADLTLQPGSFSFTASTNQAGAHADVTTNFAFNTDSAGSAEGNLKDTVVNLPVGFAGAPTAAATCTPLQLEHNQGFRVTCPVDSQLGTITLTVNPYGSPFLFTVPVYNMVPAPGEAARFGFNIGGIISQNIAFTVRPGDYGLTATTTNISGGLEIDGISLTVWGVPADPSHDPLRGAICRGDPSNPANCFISGGLSAGVNRAPFLTNPTQCTGAPLTATLSADSWQAPDQPQTASAEVGPITGCDRLGFDPALTVQPTTDKAGSATGLNVDLNVPQNPDPDGFATSHLKKAVVTLPQGMTLNPSAGAGLGVCTPAQYEAETATSLPGEGCPNNSKVGDVNVQTPALTEQATGSLYIAKPFDNPFNSLLALYIVAKIPDRGIIVKAAGQVTPDPLTGQLTTTFDENPQLPFNDFTLSFRQGQTSPLISPPACGAFTAAGELTPWSDPTVSSPVSSVFEITHGVGGGACPSGGTPPFHPGLVAGSINNLAGSYSPFYVRLSRQDGEQEITHFSIKLPPGLVGKLAGIPFCSDAQIAQALSRSHEGMAAIEEADPSCPAASQVGRTIVEAGVGTVLAQAPGKVYLAGPYHGSAVSIVAITDAHVGPFDLGTVVVQEGFKVNPETAEVFVDSVGSDPIPHIIDGIPTHLRNIRVYMDRPNFVLNPTSCEPTSTASTVLGSGLNFASEADDQPVTVSSPFQAADCASLGFHPNLKLSLKGKTNRGAHPALKAVLTTGPGEANIARAQVTLPRSEFLENAHIRTICTRVQFAAGAGNGANCPPASIYGYARAITPLLSEPLEGPVFLRSSEHQLPDLVAALHSGEINIDLLGHIDSLHGQIRNTFEAVPDAPVTKFVLEMQGAGKGLLVNSTNLCEGTHRAIVDFTAHNGKLKDTTPVLRPRCAKHHKAKHKHRRARRGR